MNDMNGLLSSQSVQALETRMSKEYATSMNYKLIRAYFENLNFNGFAKYFAQEADGELHHGHMIEDFLAQKQANYNILSVPYEPRIYSNIKEIFDNYVLLEQETTNDLYAIDDLAVSIKDHATHSWLNAVREGQEFAPIPYQDEELQNAYDLRAEVMRVLGADEQLQTIGLNAIDKRLLGD